MWSLINDDALSALLKQWRQRRQLRHGKTLRQSEERDGLRMCIGCAKPNEARVQGLSYDASRCLRGAEEAIQQAVELVGISTAIKVLLTPQALVTHHQVTASKRCYKSIDKICIAS